MAKIAIIGTGNVGSAIGAGAVKAGYAVVFAARDGDKVQAAAPAAEIAPVSPPEASLTKVG